MAKVKFTVDHTGLGYNAGDEAELSQEVAEFLIKIEQAIPVKSKETKERANFNPEVENAAVK